MQFTLSVPKMSCGGCVNAITNAVKSVDEGATVDADIATKTVKIETAGSAQVIMDVLTGIGYPALIKDN